MLPFKLVYSHRYLMPIGGHIFPADKYRRTYEQALATGIAGPEDFIEPTPATNEDVLLVHSPFYVDKLDRGLISTREEIELEMPFSRALADVFWHFAGGSILASECALQDKVSVHLGGGFHHAFPDHGEGFCLIHDVAIAIRKMQQTGRVQRVLVIDCDVHQGNGTAFIFGESEPEPFPKPVWSASLTARKRPASIKTGPSRDVFTVSLHQENNYPAWKPPSSLDVNLPDGTTDEQYMEWLRTALQHAQERFPAPQLICYIAGADPYVHDQLGGLALSIDGLKQRDVEVLTFARQAGVPIMVTYAGGYATSIADTVTIHTNTIDAARIVFS